MVHEIKVGQHGEGCECPHCSIYWPYAQWKEADQTKCETLRKKKPWFQPEYFSGLNWREALKKELVGKVVEFTDDLDTAWTSGVLGGYTIPPMTKKFIKKDSEIYWSYIRTCPETHKPPTITIGGVKLPKPEIDAPREGTTVFLWTATANVQKTVWKNRPSDWVWIKNGLIHLTLDRAQAWADWWNNTVVKAVNK